MAISKIPDTSPKGDYIAIQWVTFTYYTADQLSGTYNQVVAPQGYSARLLGVFSMFNNDATGIKANGAILNSTNRNLRICGSGFVSGDTMTLPVVFQIYKT